MKEGLSYFTDTYLTSVGLMIFFSFFSYVAWWITRPKNKEFLNYMESLPLKNGDQDEHR